MIQDAGKGWGGAWGTRGYGSVGVRPAEFSVRLHVRIMKRCCYRTRSHRDGPEFTATRTRKLSSSARCWLWEPRIVLDPRLCEAPQQQCCPMLSFVRSCDITWPFALSPLAFVVVSQLFVCRPPSLCCAVMLSARSLPPPMLTLALVPHGLLHCIPLPLVPISF